MKLTSCYRFEPVHSAANVDGHENSFGEANGNSHNITRNAYGGELPSLSGQDPVAKTKLMRKVLSTKCGIVASETHDLSMRFIGDVYLYDLAIIIYDLLLKMYVY